MAYRVRALVEYDGTDYAGFQRQKRQPSIQAEIEAVLRKLTGEEIAILHAGRTDAGVHAEGQVIAFDTNWRHDVADLERGMNALLPASIAVRQVELTSARFHPRYDAKSRLYRYRILNQPTRSPLQERYAYRVGRLLDVPAMEKATQTLVGSHDFATFGRPMKGETTVREVYKVHWGRDGRLIWMDIEANAFLRRMVRSIVGAALRVGLGESTVEEFMMDFAARDRSRSAPPAPPHGLCLIAVRYAEERDDGKPARQG
jgi:tRNA pseudouridine38-40 synthase